jgi:hemolysin activation/secretion protein
LAALLFGLPSVAFAQGASQPLSPTIDPSRALPPAAPAAQTPIAPPTPAVPTAPPAADTTARFTLVDVRFDGAGALSDSQLEPAWASYRGKPVSLFDLRDIARKAEQIYADDGYPFVVIVVPPQAVSGGMVHLSVVEGHISNLTVLSKDPTARRQATAAFSPLVDKAPLSLGDVDDAYQRARDVPGLAVSGALRRGDEPGGMDLVVQTQRDDWRAYANVNNYYPDATGPWGVLLGLDYFGHSAWGDVTSGQFYSSVDGGQQYVLRLSHDRRLNASGTDLSLETLFAWANPQGAIAPLDIAENVDLGRIAVSQPLVRSSEFRLDGSVAFEVNDQDSLVFKSTGLTRDRLQEFSATLTGVWKPKWGGDATLALTGQKGVDIWDASQPGDPDLSRPGADPEAFVGQLHFSGETPPVLDVSLYGHVEGQVADHALTAPDEYAIGNLTIGRGYEPGAAFGDSAIAYSGEVRLGPFTAFNKKFQAQPFAFYDAARLWVLTPGAHLATDIASYGGGVRFDLPGLVHVELAYAVPLKAPFPGLGVPDNRFLVNVTVGLNQAYQYLFQRGSKGDAR